MFVDGTHQFMRRDYMGSSAYMVKSPTGIALIAELRPILLLLNQKSAFAGDKYSLSSIKHAFHKAVNSRFSR